MAQQGQHDPTISSMDAQLSDMISELYNSEAVIQTGRFVPSTQSNSSMQLFGRTRDTAVSLPTSVVSSPATKSKNRDRTNVAVGPPPPPPPPRQQQQRDDNDDEYEPTIGLRRTVREKYHCRTLDINNINRMAILPIFPSTNVKVEIMSKGNRAAAAAAASPLSLSGKTAHLLLSNVPLGLLNTEQYVRLRRGTFPLLFKLEKNNEITTATNLKDSFLLDFYQEFYGNLKTRLKVDISILDFNATRLRECVNQVVAQYHLEQTMLNVDELPLALEFYLQIDVDMFFLKTCSFNGVQPRLFDQVYLEGLFCLDTPQARFAITPCQRSSCLCCHPSCPRRDSTAAIQFSAPSIHRFINQYEAILNCPATCESKNCIYVLTCPCQQFDFIGESKVSFAETLASHREEGNRIIREFLIGERNVEYITQGLKSEKKKINDKSWLYQHSARCSIALQLFLDYNPEYWCFVPMKSVEQQFVHGTVRGYLSRQSSYRAISTPSESDRFTTWIRKDADVRLLMDNLPQPPYGYSFNHYQRQQQANFFKWTQDRNVPLYNVDLYNANIIAICMCIIIIIIMFFYLHIFILFFLVPNNVSKLFRKLIESLLITHAACKLNQSGHLVRSDQQMNVNPNRALENNWCVNLTHHPSYS